MAEKHLLYFTSQQVSVYRWKDGELTVEKILPATEEGAAFFGEFLSVRRKSLYYILADLVEEDFSQEAIPAVRGRDRKMLLQRKLAQRYRDTSLSLALSLGVEKAGERQEEQILFSSFTNTQQFQPWLEVLRAQSARVVGIYSVPLVAPIVGKKIGLKNTDYLFVSLEAAGLRQTYIRNGQLRFSRLGNADRSDPGALAGTCAAESSRIQQYLANLRIISRDAGPLHAVVLAPGKDKHLYDAACQSNASLQYQVLDLEETARTAGLKTAPGEVGAAALFLHVLALSQPGEQFASNDLRHFYNIWRSRIATVVVGATAFAFCLILSGLKLVDIYSVNRQINLDHEQEAAATQEYARMQVTFPKTPTPSDKLKLVVKNYQSLLEQTLSPEPFLTQISSALSASPQVELERIEWSVAGAGPAEAAKSPVPKSAVQPSGGAAGGGPVQTAVISGRVTIGQSTDYRGITQVVDNFVQELRNQPGIDIASRRLPFDVTAEKSLSGDIGATRSAEVPRFTVVVHKRKNP